MMGATVAQFVFIRPGESPELGEDLQGIFEELAARLDPEWRALSLQCHPALDVYEHDASIEVVMDAAGLQSDAVRVVYRAGLILVAGVKLPAPVQPEPQFHLVEREFGRFHRSVRVSGAFDLPAATAVLQDGELTIVLPKRQERRGVARPIPVTGAPRP
jgi:HSP20 family protein